MSTWYGIAFETLCWNHIAQIKNALGIPSVHTEEFSWRFEGTKEYKGAQIDLMIRRADNIINLCEMKFCIADYVLDKTEDASLRNKIASFQRVTQCRETIIPTLVTTYGLVNNTYSISVQSVITTDDLYAF